MVIIETDPIRTVFRQVRESSRSGSTPGATLSGAVSVQIRNLDSTMAKSSDYRPVVEANIYVVWANKIFILKAKKDACEEHLNCKVSFQDILPFTVHFMSEFDEVCNLFDCISLLQLIFFKK
jgi:hypothetical protein